MTQQLTEHADWRGSPIRVDRQAGVIHGVKILGLASKNGRIYRTEALEKSIPLYEGARVNVNHPRGGPAVPRGYEERIGVMRNVRFAGDGLYGDFHYNPKHTLAEQLLWDAQHAPESVGFSHNVLARTSLASGQTVVEEIAKVQSVDLVADPATTRGLFEGHSAAPAPSCTSSGSPREPEVARLLEENQQLRAELQSLRLRESESHHRAGVDRAIEAAGVPRELDTALFRSQCYQAGDTAALTELIEARLHDARLLRLGQRPRSIEQNRELAAGSVVVDAASFAASIQ